MAIYRLEVKIIGRSSGHKAVGAAAYRSGDKLHDERNQETHDYSRKKNIERSQIFAPSHAPEWVHDRGRLWNGVEEIEKRKDSQLAREVLISIPRELSPEKRWSLIENFTQNEFVSKGMIADVYLHNGKAADGGENPHAHIMLTMRDISADGFQQKNRDWNNAVFTKDDYIKDKSSLVGLRGKWAEYANNALTDSGSDLQISHLSNEAQGKTIALPVPPLVAHHIHQKENGASYVYNSVVDEQAKHEARNVYHSHKQTPQHWAAVAQNKLALEHEQIKHRRENFSPPVVEISHAERLRKRQSMEQSHDYGGRY